MHRRDWNPCERGVHLWECAPVPWQSEPYITEHREACKRLSCPDCEPHMTVTPSGGDGFRSHRTVLGSPRMAYAKWAAAFTLYTWPLWRNWTPPVALTVESVADVARRQRRAKPVGYVWKLWHEHATARVRPDASRRAA